MPLSRPRLILSALRGGGGKTTLSLAVTATWRSQGLRVAPFKKGPDYIDAGWLERAAGLPCHHLDPFLMNWADLAQVFLNHSSPDSIALIEGNRGLYDGLDPQGSTSTAELAKRLRAPVVLVVDATKTTRTAAALVLGCKMFDPEVNIAGVIVNQVAGARHEKVVTQSIEQGTGLPVLGVLPRFRLEMPERHMGLVPCQEHPQVAGSLEKLTDLAAGRLDFSRLEQTARTAPDLPDDLVASLGRPTPKPERISGPAPRIAVIRDSAFQFYYPENIEALEQTGAEVVFVEALTADRLPEVDGLYIGGGFPETHCRELAANEPFRNSVRAAAESGLPIYAECGGLMFLGARLTCTGRVWPMAGVLPIEVEVCQKPQGHGYVRAVVDRPNPFYPVGTELKGHEFHYSRVTNLSGHEKFLTMEMVKGVGVVAKRDGLVYKNTLAAYTHIHAGGTPIWSQSLVAKAAERARHG